MPKPLTVPGVETQSDSDSSLSLIPCVLSVPGWLMVKITLSDCWLPLSPHGPKYPYSLNVQVLSSCEILIMVLTVLQIPLWLDFGLVSQSSWSSCFLCWPCWPRQEPHTKSKSGLLRGSVKLHGKLVKWKQCPGLGLLPAGGEKLLMDSLLDPGTFGWDHLRPGTLLPASTSQVSPYEPEFLGPFLGS